MFIKSEEEMIEVIHDHRKRIANALGLKTDYNSIVENYGSIEGIISRIHLLRETSEANISKEKLEELESLRMTVSFLKNIVLENRNASNEELVREIQTIICAKESFKCMVKEQIDELNIMLENLNKIK